MRGRRRLQYAAVCALLAAYAGLSHYCNSNAGARNLGALLALGPFTVLALILAWRSTAPIVAVLLTIGLAGLLVEGWPLVRLNFPMFYLVQESGVYCLLGATFGRSLLPGKTALCTQLADRLHGPLSDLEVRYTRRVTAAWALFFVGVAAVSIGLFLWAPLRIWSLYINFCVAPLVAAMFVGEYLVRRRVLPVVPRAGLLATVQVYFTRPHSS